MNSDYRWPAGVLAALVVGGAASSLTGVDPAFAGVLGVTWGLIVWTFVGYPESVGLSYRDLQGDDRWLAAAQLVAAACGFATIRFLPVSGAFETLLYAELLGVLVAIMTTGALVGRRTKS